MARPCTSARVARYTACRYCRQARNFSGAGADCDAGERSKTAGILMSCATLLTWLVMYDREVCRPGTEELWIRGRSRKIPANVTRVAVRKLAQLHFATRLDDLRAPRQPPGG